MNYYREQLPNVLLAIMTSLWIVLEAPSIALSVVLMRLLFMSLPLYLPVIFAGNLRGWTTAIYFFEFVLWVGISLGMFPQRSNEEFRWLWAFSLAWACFYFAWQSTKKIERSGLSDESNGRERRDRSE